MLIGTNRQLRKLPGDLCSVKLNNVPVPYATHVRNLGLIVDQQLKWDRHVSHICSSIYLKLRNLSCHKNYLSKEMRKRLVVSLLLPVFDYCDVIYGTTNISQCNRLKKNFNSCVRFICGLRKYDHISAAFQELNILAPEFRHALHTSILTFKVLQNGFPIYLKEDMQLLSDNHSYSTRDALQLKVPTHKLELFKQSFRYSSVNTWNHLPIELRSANCTHKFSNQAKMYWKSKQNVSGT